MRRGVAVTLPLLLLIHFGCGPSESPQEPSPGIGDGAHIGWILPTPGESSLADTIRIDLAVAGIDIGEVAVMADDSILALKSHPPWRVHWLPLGGARAIRLGAATGKVRSPDREIRWSPNQSPSTQITGLPAAGGIERGPGYGLHAAAFDPEDGDLDGRSIIWSSDVQGILGFGRRIPSESLIAGRHVVRVRASDRWGRSTTAVRSIEVFDPPDPTTPESALAALRHAMISADSADYISLIDPDFRFLLCPAERQADPSLPTGWGFAEEHAFAGRLANLNRADWTVSSVQRTPFQEEEWAKGEIRGMNLSYGESPEGALQVVGGGGRIYLRRPAGGDTWKVIQWNDLGATGLSYGRLRIMVAGQGDP